MFSKKIIVIVLNKSREKEFGKEFYDKKKVSFAPRSLKGYLRRFLLKIEMNPKDRSCV